MSCCNNDAVTRNELILLVNKSREAAACAEANCGSSFTNATNSATSATNAAASAAAAAESAQLCGIYLGAKAVAPTTDNEGGPLQEGMLYFNTTSNGLFVWNGSAWASAEFNEFTNFTATGTTAARNLVTRFADVVNVKDFGAVGDGVADDTAAFNAAATAVNNLSGQVIIPKGLYLLTSNTQQTTWIVDAKSSFSGLGSISGRIVKNGNSGIYSKGSKIGAVENYITTGVRPFTEDASDLSVLSTIGQIGLLGGSQSSLSPNTGSQGCIGVAAFSNNNNIVAIQSSYAGYFESRRQINTGITHGIEIDIVNFGATSSVRPDLMAPNDLSNAMWIASGGGAIGATDATVAIGIINNGAKFKSGIVFGTDSLVNIGGENQAIILDKNMSLIWMSGTNLTSRIRSDATSSSIGIVFSNNTINIQNIAGSNILSIGDNNTITSTSTLTLQSPSLNFSTFTTSNTATSGSASALPATPRTYIVMKISGIDVKIPCYNV